jgi:hypothetical protein
LDLLRRASNHSKAILNVKYFVRQSCAASINSAHLRHNASAGQSLLPGGHVKLLYFALLLAVCLAPTQEKSVSENSVEASIRHVTVINFGNGSEPKVQTLTIRGNRIASIAVTQDSDNSLSNSIDARGAFLIPGLWDLHVHVHDVNELPLYIANGVTGIRVMSGEKDTAAYRAELARQQPSPEIYLASAIVDGSPPIWPGSIVVKKPDDARRSVDEIKTSGADFIKVYTRVPRDAYFALAAEAKQQHIDFEGHLPDSVTARKPRAPVSAPWSISKASASPAPASSNP